MPQAIICDRTICNRLHRSCCGGGNLINVATRFTELVTCLSAVGPALRTDWAHTLFDRSLFNGFNMRVNRSLIVLTLALLVIVGMGLSSAAAPEVEKIDITSGKAQRPISLRDRLVVGLQARLKTEVTFCETVAMKVQLGQLPQRMVDETFLWARQRTLVARNGHKYRPILYFQPAMKARADRLHLVL